MDALTAAAATMAVQLSMALVMGGTYYASSGERSTRYWALSGLLSAMGVLIVIVNAGAPKIVLSMIGNNAIVASLVVQWCGIRVFYRKRPSVLGWLILGAFFVLFLRSLLLIVFPFASFHYLPGNVLFGKGAPLIALGVAPLAALVTLFLAQKAWNLGLEHYESTGS